MTKTTILLFFLFLLATALSAQDTNRIRICTYNVLNFGPSEDTNRIAAMRKVLAEVDAEIVVVQELNGEPGTLAFLHTVAGPLLYPISSGFDGPDTDNGIIFKGEELIYHDHLVLPTPLRNIDEFILHVNGSDDTLHIFVCHLKAGNTPEDSIQRVQEAQILRNRMDTLPAHHHRIVAGDLNVYTSQEEAYQVLTRIGIVAAGEVVDPINRPGDWHDNTEFADIHTQSPRTRLFGGGINGGMDDRFDFILLSASLLDGEYQSGSYTAFGNDGNHMNDSINAGTNNVVSQETAQALHDASDHLPVFLDLVFVKKSSGVEGEEGWKKKPMDLTGIQDPQK